MPKQQKRVAPLSARARDFVREYKVDRNGTKAAIRAGFAELTAGKTAHRLLRHPDVIADLTAWEAEKAKSLDITAERVLKELARIAFSRVTDIADFSGRSISLKASDQLSDDVLATVAEISESGEDTPRLRVKLHDKLAALDKLARHLGLFKGEDPNAQPGAFMLVGVGRPLSAEEWQKQFGPPAASPPTR